MAAGRDRRLLLPLLPLLLCVVPLAAPELKGNKEVKDGVDFTQCPPGQYVVNGSCETCSGATYMDHLNNETKCKPCNVECGIKEELDSDYTHCTKDRCQCREGHCKDKRSHPEGCYPCPSENHIDAVSDNATRPGSAGTMDSGGHDPVTRTPYPVMTGPHREATVTHLPGLAGNSSLTPQGNAGISNWVICIGVVITLCVVVMLIPVVVHCIKNDQLHDRWVRCTCCFRDPKQHQGQVHHVRCSDPRNSFEMSTVLPNGHCNPETHNLLRGEHSDFASDSAISIVPEVMPRSGSPEIPPPDQVTMEQEPGCTSVARIP